MLIDFDLHYLDTSLPFIQSFWEGVPSEILGSFCSNSYLPWDMEVMVVVGW